MNVDLCQGNNNYETNRYIDTMIGCYVKCIINKPTRITPTSKTLLDHVHTNNTLSSCYLTCSISLCNVSDHYGTFVIIPDKKTKLKVDYLIFIRDFKRFHLECFLEDLSSQMNFLHVSDSENVNELFDTFVDKFAKIVNNHASLKKASRRESKLKSKPWLFPGQLKCIKRKNRMFKLIHNKFSPELRQKYKKFRNTLNRAIGHAKQNYCNKLFINNKSKFVELWNAIQELTQTYDF